MPPARDATDAPHATAGLPPEIGLTHLTNRFGEVVAVDDVSLTIGEGEFFSLLGPSGAARRRRCG